MEQNATLLSTMTTGETCEEQRAAYTDLSRPLDRAPNWEEKKPVASEPTLSSKCRVVSSCATTNENQKEKRQDFLKESAEGLSKYEQICPLCWLLETLSKVTRPIYLLFGNLILGLGWITKKIGVLIHVAGRNLERVGCSVSDSTSESNVGNNSDGTEKHTCCMKY